MRHAKCKATARSQQAARQTVSRGVRSRSGRPAILSSDPASCSFERTSASSSDTFCMRFRASRSHSSFEDVAMLSCTLHLVVPLSPLCPPPARSTAAAGIMRPSTSCTPILTPPPTPTTHQTAAHPSEWSVSAKFRWERRQLTVPNGNMMPLASV
jgi:hypothetical protein